MKSFFYPSSVAVVGATETEGKVGYSIMKNLLEGGLEKTKEFQFKGVIYPVNRKRKQIMGIKVYPSLSAVPKVPELALIAVPAGEVINVVKEGLSKGIKRFVVISAGFSESGEEGRKRERELVELVKENGGKLIGPNCLGIMSTPARMNLSFARVSPPPGKIAFISQSGAIGSSVVEYAREELFGISHFVSTGNKADVDDSDLMEFLRNDDHAYCISIYIESAKDGRKFFDTLKRVTPYKPVVVLKSGTTEVGMRAARSHTGSMAGRDDIYSAAINQAGGIRARTMYEFFDFSRALAYQPPVEKGIAILTNAGGPGVIAADTAVKLGLPLAKLSERTLREIDKVCPPTWSKGNPVDIIGDADAERFSKTLQILMNAPEVGGIVFIVSRQGLTMLDEISERLVDCVKNHQHRKAIVACFVGIIGQEDLFLNTHGIPVMEVPERSVRAMFALYRRGKFLKRLQHAEDIRGNRARA